MKKQLLNFFLCLTAVIFAVSCGNSANTTTNPGNDGNGSGVDLYVSQITYGMESKYNYISINSDEVTASKGIRKNASLKFNIGAPSSISQCKAEIISVKNGSDNYSDVKPEASWFTIDNTINSESPVKLTLSDLGVSQIYLNKNSLEKAKEYKYTLTIKFTTDSEEAKNKEYSLDVDIFIVPLKIITKTDIEMPLRSIKISSSDTQNKNKIEFDLLGFTLNKMGFERNATETLELSWWSFSARDVRDMLTSEISKQLISLDCFKTTYDSNIQTVLDIDNSASTAGNKTANFIFKFQLKDWCELDDESKYITTDGMKIIVKLSDAEWISLP